MSVATGVMPGVTSGNKAVMADKLKLLAAVLIFAIGVGGFYYFGDKPDYLRVAMVLVAAGIAVAVALQTTVGRAALEFAKGSRQEMRKVVWPERKEATQMTLVVFAMVVLVALFLWVIDWGLLKIVRALTGQGA
jgi:preprotein translocase subunit SecE